MFGSTFLEVSIGLTFFYAIVSLAVAAIIEFLSAVLRRRAGTLAAGITRLIGDPRNAGFGTRLLADIYAHPMINRVYAGNQTGKLFSLLRRGPSYIPSRSFVIALLDSLRTRQVKNATAAEPISAEELLGNAAVIVRGMDDGRLKHALTLLVGDRAETERAVRPRSEHVAQALEAWFDEAMDRLSDRYKRMSQYLSIVIGVGFAVAVDADALRIIANLWENEALRSAVVVKAGAAALVDTANPAGQLALLGQVKGFPIGGASTEMLLERFKNPAIGVQSAIGWLITGFVVSLGAGIWFDMLKKAVRSR